MKRIDTEIPGVLLLEPRVFSDSRGYFTETWNARTFEGLGLPVTFVQDNESVSRKGVVRGLHFQGPAAAQAKLVRVIRGEILDVALDIRVGSPTFGKYLAVKLDAQSHRQMFIPKGFAHGFSVLSDEALVAYKCDAFYSSEDEITINPLDTDLNIEWGSKRTEMILSNKDRSAMSLAEYYRNPVFKFGTCK